MARSEEELFDVILKVDDVDFPCHREILAKYSSYFRAMFSISNNFIERNMKCIEIQGVDSDAMEAMLRYIYQNEELNFLKLNILSVLQASSMLQFESIQKSCINLILNQWLNISTCLQTMSKAYELDLTKVYRKAKAIALYEFSTLKYTDAFLDLDIHIVEIYLTNDGLNTEEEFEVFEAAINWAQFKPSQRSKDFQRILKCVRFCDISVSDIKTMLLYPFVIENLECQQILQYILCIKEGKEINVDLQERSPRNSIDRESKNSVDDKSLESKQKRIKTCLCMDTETNEEPNCRYCTGVQVSVTSNDEVQYHSDCHNKFTLEVIKTGTDMLIMHKRTLPMIPCVVGHKIYKGKDIDTDMNTEMNTFMFKLFKDTKKKNQSDKKKRMQKKKGKPYVFYFQEESQQPLPFLQLSKANEGPNEPVGYKVFSKGQDIYIFGGEILLGYSNWNKSVWKFDIFKERWSYVTSMNTPRRHHSVCCIGDCIYVIGGFGRHRLIMDTVEKYNIVSKSWYVCSPLPQNVYSIACCVFNEHIFAFGPQLYVYLPDSDKWITLSEVIFPAGLAFSSAMPHGKWIYLTCSYNRELTRFGPHLDDEDKLVLKFETIGCFKYLTLNTCLVHDVVYSFAKDDSDNLYIEAYHINENEFCIVWDSVSKEDNEILDFSTVHSIGCFSLLRY